MHPPKLVHFTHRCLCKCKEGWSDRIAKVYFPLTFIHSCMAWGWLERAMRCESWIPESLAAQQILCVCRPFVESLLNLLQYCFCFMFWFYCQEAYRILASWSGFQPALQVALEGKGFTTGPPGNSLLNRLHWRLRERPLCTAEMAIDGLTMEIMKTNP